MLITQHVKELIKAKKKASFSLIFSADGVVIRQYDTLSASDACFVAATIKAFMPIAENPECKISTELLSGNERFVTAIITPNGLLYYLVKLKLQLDISEYDDLTAALYLSAKG
jgi:hypothetical protein